MGIGFDISNQDKDKYKEAIEKLGNILVYRTINPLLLYNKIYFFTLTYHKQKRLIKTLHSVSEIVIKKRKENALNTKTETESFHLPPKKKLALLDLLLASKENGNLIDDEGLREEVDTFIFAVSK